MHPSGARAGRQCRGTCVSASADGVVVSVLTSVVSVTGANHTSFANLVISDAQGTTAALSGTNLHVTNCTVSNSGRGCLGLSGANSSVANCTVFGCGGSGVSLVGGDRHTLEPANLSVTGSAISNYSRVRRTYEPGIGFSGVGIYVAHNDVSHAPHTAINGAGNDNLFEYNTIKHSCYETIDTGAFYVGRSWSQRGNVVRCRLPGILAHIIVIDFLSRLPTTVIGHTL